VFELKNRSKAASTVGAGACPALQARVNYALFSFSILLPEWREHLNDMRGRWALQADRSSWSERRPCTRQVLKFLSGEQRGEFPLSVSASSPPTLKLIRVAQSQIPVSRFTGNCDIVCVAIVKQIVFLASGKDRRQLAPCEVLYLVRIEKMDWPLVFGHI